MNKRITLLYIALALSLVWVAFSYIKSLEPTGVKPVAQDSQQKERNERVEDFELKSDTGKPVRLTNYRGQVVALVFYASW